MSASKPKHQISFKRTNLHIQDELILIPSEWKVKPKIKDQQNRGSSGQLKSESRSPQVRFSLKTFTNKNRFFPLIRWRPEMPAESKRRYSVVQKESRYGFKMSELYVDLMIQRLMSRPCELQLSRSLTDWCWCDLEAIYLLLVTVGGGSAASILSTWAFT